MISWQDFESIVIRELQRDIRRSSDASQHAAIVAPANQSLFVPAGPGSGKTTVIALRVLKLIYVDGVDSSSILVTTFTKKAAAELRSRILGWGDLLKRAFVSHPSYSGIAAQLAGINFNNIVTGTLDSIAEEVLGNPGVRAPGMPAPAVVEPFVSNAIMIRAGLFDHGRHRDPNLDAYIAGILGSRFGLGVSEKSGMLLNIWNRICDDRIDITAYRTGCSHAGARTACDAMQDYSADLSHRLLFDFPRLEQEFLTQLQGGAIDLVLGQLKFVLVDEYQDTNLLQEEIYFSLTRLALGNGGSVTVVGDDDQSLYRFRGATVDLFQTFPARISGRLAANPRVVHLSSNYRSTARIVNFFNGFLALDQSFQNARVQNKPRVVSMRRPPYTDYPVLGMFRANVNTLANDLAGFIRGVIYGGGVPVPGQGDTRHIVRVSQQGGQPGDIALLCSSPRELDSQGNSRLPLLLKMALQRQTPVIPVFNPRGEPLELVQEVQQLCGLILECLDPQGAIQNSIQRLPQNAVAVFGGWRGSARTLMGGAPPQHRRNIRAFVNAWQQRIPLGRPNWQQREVPLLDLVYKLVTWIPSMQSDSEGLVYLEAVMRTISQTSFFSNFGADIVIDASNRGLEEASIREVIWNILTPIATGAIEVNEDLLETLPNDKINIMSIHQVKGLEFPLVIVDVGSDFRQCHPAHAFKRFPYTRQNGQVDRTNSVNLEDELRPYSPLGRSTRVAVDRAFDDLIRHYYVSYSRPQDVLLLVGLDSVRNGYYLASRSLKDIPSVSTGWDRQSVWHWGRGLPNLTHI